MRAMTKKYTGLVHVRVVNQDSWKVSRIRERIDPASIPVQNILTVRDF